MAQEKSCSGTQTINNFFLANPLCIYQLTISIDGSPITNTVPINSGLTPAQIATLLNANRTGNTTGVFTVQQVGNNLVIIITGIVLDSGDSGDYTVAISGTGGDCPDFTVQLATLTCTIIPRIKKGRRGGYMVAPMTFCCRRHYDDQKNLILCPPKIQMYGAIYELTSSDSEKCCYRRVK